MKCEHRVKTPKGDGTYVGSNIRSILLLLGLLLGGQVDALFSEDILLRILDSVRRPRADRRQDGTYAFEVLGVNVALLDAAANLLLDLGVITEQRQRQTFLWTTGGLNVPQLIVAINGVKIILIAALVTGFPKMEDLGTRHAAPGSILLDAAGLS